MDNIVTPDILADIDRAKADIEASKSKELMYKLYNIGMRFIPEVMNGARPILYNWNSVTEEKRLITMKTAYIFLATNKAINEDDIAFAENIFDEHIFKMFALDEKSMLVNICNEAFLTTADTNKFAMLSAVIHSLDRPLRDYFQLLLILTSKAKVNKLANEEALEKLCFMKSTLMEVIYSAASSMIPLEKFSEIIIANIPLGIEDIDYVIQHIQFSKLSYVDAVKQLHLDKYKKKSE